MSKLETRTGRAITSRAIELSEEIVKRHYAGQPGKWEKYSKVGADGYVLDARSVIAVANSLLDRVA